MSNTQHTDDQGAADVGRQPEVAETKSSPWDEEPDVRRDGSGRLIIDGQPAGFREARDAILKSPGALLALGGVLYVVDLLLGGWLLWVLLPGGIVGLVVAWAVMRRKRQQGRE